MRDFPGTIEVDGINYMPVRLCSEAVGGELIFDETTEEINISVAGKTLAFKDGATNNVFVNGTEYTLKNSMVNKDYVNYISVSDVAEIFEKNIIEKDGLTVISDIDKLFTPVEDDVLLRYIKEKLTVY